VSVRGLREQTGHWKTIRLRPSRYLLKLFGSFDSCIASRFEGFMDR